MIPRLQFVEKVCFYKIEQILNPFKNALWALRRAKPLGVLYRHPCRNPKPLPRGEGLCMLCWLCIVQSLWAYTPGIRAGAILLGLPPSPRLGLRPKPHFKKLYRFFDILRAAVILRLILIVLLSVYRHIPV